VIALRLATALACLAALGCAPTRKPAEPTGPHFSVLTYNVNFGGPRPDLAAEAIRNADADVVALQETNPAWERFLRPRLEERYAHVRFRHCGGAGGMAFLSKWPLRERAYARPEAGWFPGWVVEIQTPVGPVQFLNVHLRPPVSGRGSVGIGPYFSTKPIRLAEVQALHKRLEPGKPTIILGDFNEDDSGRAVRWLRGQGMTDALREFDRRTSTWRWRTRYLTLRHRLDHILYSPELHCLSAGVVKAGGSDHYPVIALFQKAREGEAPAEPPSGSAPRDRGAARRQPRPPGRARTQEMGQEP